MGSGRREPSLWDLDIYRLVTVRRWKQKHVAESFDVQPSRVSQVVRASRSEGPPSECANRRVLPPLPADEAGASGVVVPRQEPAEPEAEVLTSALT